MANPRMVSIPASRPDAVARESSSDIGQTKSLAANVIRCRPAEV